MPITFPVDVRLKTCAPMYKLVMNKIQSTPAIFYPDQLKCSYLQGTMWSTYGRVDFFMMAASSEPSCPYMVRMDILFLQFGALCMYLYMIIKYRTSNDGVGNPGAIRCLIRKLLHGSDIDAQLTVLPAKDARSGHIHAP